MLKRKATLKDVEAIAQLDLACFGGEAWSRQQIEGSLDLDTTEGWGVFDDAQLVSFYLLQKSGDEAEILTLGVSPAYRRQGLGESLLRHILARQEDGDCVYLEVAADNQAAISLYNKCGFTLLGQRPNYYRRGLQKVDALTYRCLVKSGS